MRRFRRTFWEDPERLLELSLYEMVGRAKDQEFRCLVCEEKVESKTNAERHLLSHYLEKPAVDWVMEERTVVTQQEAEDEQTEEEEDDDQEPRRRRRKKTAGLRASTVQQYSPPEERAYWVLGSPGLFSSGSMRSLATGGRRPSRACRTHRACKAEIRFTRSAGTSPRTLTL